MSNDVPTYGTTDEGPPSPAWLDRETYPFASRWFKAPAGRMHYVDEGRGEVLVMVHGTPDWSFQYRTLIKCLSQNYRCIAMDYLGFGLSDKPADWAYTPEAHAANVAALIEGLGLSDVTLVVHDFGGPIGLSYALDHPVNVRRLILFNTWMFSGRGTKRYRSWRRVSRILGGRFGKLLYERFNFSARVVLKQSFADKSKLPRRVHQQYIQALPTPASRRGTWMFAKHLVASGDWYDGLWARRAKIADKPTLILWGTKDVATGPEFLAKFRDLFTRAQVEEYDVGHFPQEEVGEALCPVVEQFLSGAR